MELKSGGQCEMIKRCDFSHQQPSLSSYQLNDLHVYDIRQILSFLSEEELLALRLVSKKVKEYVENELQLFTRVLNVGDNIESLDQINFITALYPRIDTVKFTSWQLPAEKVVSILADNLRNLTCLGLNGGASSSCLPRLPQSFASLRKLDVTEMNVDDGDVSAMLSGLKNLETIAIGSEYSKNRVTGKCFADAGEKLRSIKWTVDRRVTFRGNLTLNGGGERIKALKLMIPYGKNENNLQVVSFITREMPNLRKLRLELCDVQLNGLEALTQLEKLKLDGYIGNPIRFGAKLRSVTRLSIDGYGQTDDQLAEFLRYFPNLVDLKLALNRKEPHETDVLMNAICGLSSLRIFSLKDECYQFEEQRFHYYINLISRLKSLNAFNLAFEYNVAEEYLSVLISLAEKRSKQTFNVVFENEEQTKSKTVFESSNLVMKCTADNRAHFDFKDFRHRIRQQCR